MGPARSVYALGHWAAGAAFSPRFPLPHKPVPRQRRADPATASAATIQVDPQVIGGVERSPCPLANPEFNDGGDDSTVVFNI